MICENIFCIYQENDQCILKKVEHDFCGHCSECIYVDIPEDELNKVKIKIRQKLEREDNP